MNIVIFAAAVGAIHRLQGRRNCPTTQPNPGCLETSFPWMLNIVVLFNCPVSADGNSHCWRSSPTSHWAPSVLFPLSASQKTKQMFDVLGIFQTSPQLWNCLFLPPSASAVHFSPLAGVFTQQTNGRRCRSEESGVLNNPYSSYPLRCRAGGHGCSNLRLRSV